MRIHNGKTFFAVVCVTLCGAVWASSGGSSKPHMDHEPKHGGVFFMAPDRWHHLEGALLPNGTFKVHLYDDHTRPIPAKGFEAELQIDGSADARKLKLVFDAADGTLTLRGLPVEQFPVDLTVWITFPGRSGAKPQTELFSFSFDGFSSH